MRCPRRTPGNVAPAICTPPGCHNVEACAPPLAAWCFGHRVRGFRYAPPPAILYAAVGGRLPIVPKCARENLCTLLRRARRLYRKSLVKKGIFVPVSVEVVFPLCPLRLVREIFRTRHKEFAPAGRNGMGMSRLLGKISKKSKNMLTLPRHSGIIEVISRFSISNPNIWRLL